MDPEREDYVGNDPPPRRLTDVVLPLWVWLAILVAVKGAAILALAMLMPPAP